MFSPEKLTFYECFENSIFSQNCDFWARKLDFLILLRMKYYNFCSKIPIYRKKVKKLKIGIFVAGFLVYLAELFSWLLWSFFEPYVIQRHSCLNKSPKYWSNRRQRSLFSDQRNNFDFQEKTVPKSKQSKRPLRPL